AVVATWYHRLNQDRAVKLSSNRLASVLDRAVATGRKLMAFVQDVYWLRKWIKKSIDFLDKLGIGIEDESGNPCTVQPEDGLQQLRLWRQEEKREKLTELEQIELNWINLKTECIARGYRPPAPPPGFDVSVVQTVWSQLETAETRCERRIKQSLDRLAQEKYLKAKFRKKVEFHTYWLLECDQLIDVATRSDTLGIRTGSRVLRKTNCISTRLLHHQKCLFLTSCRKNAAMAVDAETHHMQKMHLLKRLQPRDQALRQIEKRWSAVQAKFTRRQTMLSQRCATLDLLMEVISSTEELDKIWEAVAKGQVDRNVLAIWESRVDVASEKVSKLLLNVDSFTHTGSDEAVGRVFARFWAANLTLRAAIVLYKGFYSKKEQLSLLSGRLCRSLATLKDQCKYVYELSQSLEIAQNQLFVAGRVDTIRVVESKFKQLAKDMECQAVECNLPECLSDIDDPKVEIQPLVRREKCEISPTPVKRCQSLVVLPSPMPDLLDFCSLRKKRMLITENFHQYFEFTDGLKPNFFRILKQNLNETLVREKTDLVWKREAFAIEFFKLQAELAKQREIIRVFLAASAVQVEVNEVAEWIRQIKTFFASIPIPDLLTTLLKFADFSTEPWWRDLLTSNTLFTQSVQLQSRIRRKIWILRRIDELKTTLKALEEEFASNSEATMDELDPLQSVVTHQLTCSKDLVIESTGCTHELVDQIQEALRTEMLMLQQELDDILQTTTERRRQLLLENENLHAIQICVDLHAWIIRSQKYLSGMESPFLCGLDLKSATTEAVPSLLPTSKEPFLAVIEKEIHLHTQESLPVIQHLENAINQSDVEATWNGLLEHVYDAWNDLILSAKMKRLSVDTAEKLHQVQSEVASTRQWVRNKKELLLSTAETKNSMGEMIRMECRMAGWETDLNALRDQVSHVFAETSSLRVALDELSSASDTDSEKSGDLRQANAALESWVLELQADWGQFEGLLEEYQKRLEASLAFQGMLQDLEATNLMLVTKQNTIAALEPPTSIAETDDQLNVFKSIASELDASKEKLEELLRHGNELILSQEEAVANAVKEKLHGLSHGWSDLEILCKHHIGNLLHQRDIQVFLRDMEALNASLRRKENQIVQTDYLPTIDHIRCNIKTQRQVLASIESLGDQMKSLQSTVHLHEFGEKYTAKVEAVMSRYIKLQDKAAKVLHLLEFRLAEKEKLHQLESMEEWILERQAAVTAHFVTVETVVKEQKAIQKYHLFRNFEAEVKSYGKLANKIFQSVQNTIIGNEGYVSNLQESLDRNMKLWNELNTTLTMQGSKLVEVYRAIIISEGCEELLEWLQKASVRIFALQNRHYLKEGDVRQTELSSLLSASMPCLFDVATRGDTTSCLPQHAVSHSNIHLLIPSSKDSGDNFDLSALNSALSKIDELKVQTKCKFGFLQELEQHFQFLVENTDKFAEHEAKLKLVKSQFFKVENRLTRCFATVSAQQRVINALRTLVDEIQWLKQKRAKINIENTGPSLLEAQKLLIRHQLLTNEVKNRKLRNEPLLKIVTVWIQLVTTMRAYKNREPESHDEYCAAFLSVQPGLWRELFAKSSELVFCQAVVQRDTAVRLAVLRHWHAWFNQQMDLLELYNWLTETESTVMAESHAARGLASANAAIKKHSIVEAIVSEFQAPRLRFLGSRTAVLLSAIAEMILVEKEKLTRCLEASVLITKASKAAGAKAYRHKLRRRIHMLERSATKLKATQASVQKQFTDLRDLVMEKKHRLYELLALNRLYKEVSDLEDWIWSRTHEVLTDNTGRDLDECARLQRDFLDLHRSIIGDGTTDQEIEHTLTHAPTTAPDFATIGQLPALPDSPERLVRAITVCRQMILLKHSDSPQIAQWQDRLIEDWCELRELLKTRGELLQAAGNRLLFLQRCEGVIMDLNDKINSFPTVLGADLKTLDRQQRQQIDLQQSIVPISRRVNWVVRAANVLLPRYADTHAAEIQTRKVRMLETWYKLNETIDTRSRMLQDAETLCKWLAGLHHSLNWIASTHELIKASREFEFTGLGSSNDGQSLQHNLAKLSAQHGELWNEICAWESCIQLQCEEGASAGCQFALEGGEYDTAPTFIGVHKMLNQTTHQLQADWSGGSTLGDVSSGIREASLVTLTRSQPPLPSQVLKCGATLLLINFCQLKVTWRRYWKHLDALTAKLSLLRDLRNLETWISTTEKQLSADELGSSLEETLALTEEHQKFSRFVALQGEKCKRLAQFELAQLNELDPEWEVAMESQLVENLKQLNILPEVQVSPEITPTNVDVVEEQEEGNLTEEESFERVEGVLYRKIEGHHLPNRVKDTHRWQKCFAVLNPLTKALHLLDITATPQAKRRWITENFEKDTNVPLSCHMTTRFVEGKGDNTCAFKVHHQVTNECHVFRAKTRSQAEKWVFCINEACSKLNGTTDLEQEVMESKAIEAQLPFDPAPPEQKQQATTCLPIRRLITKHGGGRKRRMRMLSGSSNSTNEFDGMGIKGLSPTSLLPSLGLATLGTGPHSRAMVALTFPLRALRRRIRHSNLAPSVSHSSPSSNDGDISEDISDVSLTDPRTETKYDQDETDIDAVDEFS
uniref:PH domain-containing protein n=2 Tax=Mesocestoides corti TaxID=53468 RepID=A0A5K3FD75_MESCO